MKRYHISVIGRVQGVGYRFFTVDTAVSMGLSGWVRNRPDSSVELEVQGEDQKKLDQFCEQLREGPPLARVNRLDIKELPPDPSLTEFFIR